MSKMVPSFHLEFADGRHIHHYVIGILVLTVAGYLAMIFKGPRATFWIGLLYGFAVGLTFDEFGMWLSPQVDLRNRWSFDGLGLIIGGLVVCSLIPILRRQASVAATEHEPRRETREPSTEPVTAFSQD